MGCGMITNHTMMRKEMSDFQLRKRQSTRGDFARLMLPLKEELVAKGKWPQDETFRLRELGKELSKYGRFQDRELQQKVAQRIFEMEKTLVTGQEEQALAMLLRNGHYRGTDIRLTVQHDGNHEMVPYPAYRWLWREAMAYRWKQDGHINELETQALVSHIRRLLKESAVASVKLMVVIDSQVLFYCLGKGRSPSQRLNRLLKRLMALELAGDIYVLPVWTLSAWNYADNPSRRL